MYFVGKVVALEDDGRLEVDFLRLKSAICKDTFTFPEISDVDTVERSNVLGVLNVSKGTTQRQSNLFKVFPSLRHFNMH